MEFAAFAAAAADVEARDADTAVVERVTALLGAAGEDLPVVARFAQGRVFPGWSERTLDVGPALCYKAVADAAGPEVSADDVEDRLAEAGDVGEVAAGYDLGGQRGLAAYGDGSAALTVADVFAAFESMADAEGPGSQETKVATLFGLLSRAAPAEARYLVRLVLGEMRIGVGGGTVRDAIAAAFDVPTEAVERALQVSNDYGRVAVVARDDGVEGLGAITLSVGRPVRAMLAQAGTTADALEAWGEAAVEWKFDGARVQIHYDGDEARVFSRNMEDVTDALPELVEFAEAHLDVPAIVDGEAVAVDDDGEPRPFQDILRRFRRKHDVERLREEVAVELRAFDCLHADGADLLDAPLRERHGRLDALLDGEGVSELVVTDDPERVEAVAREALAAGHEGILLKDPGAAYTPGRRGKHWLKRKPDVETLDLVVVGAEWGEGRRASLLGTFHLAARDGDGYAAVGNVATGFTDADLERLTERLRPLVRSEDGQAVDLEPELVVEVGYEEIQASPTYDSGYGLRFPRFRGVREDLDPAEADGVERVERLADGD